MRGDAPVDFVGEYEMREDRAVAEDQRGTMPEERIVRLADKPNDEAAYFAVALVPGERKPL